ncbi:hypothetical protein DVH05_017009 [Phytophthora capsici]|nr:hypothetical protein DVH05_017009 [Phytophthora capsici]
MSGREPLNTAAFSKFSSFENLRSKDSSDGKMVKPRGKVPRDFEVTGRDLSFKSVWRELKNDGWTRKPPPRSSLDDRYKYIRPEGHPNGTIGLDYFLGETAVLEFYADVLRSRARGSISSRSAVDSATSAPGDDPITHAEPHTPPAPSLSQRRVTRLPARRSLETTATFRASPTCSPHGSRSPSPLIATSPHVGGDSFEVDGDDLTSSPEAVDEDASIAAVRAGNEDNEDDLGALGSELLADNNDDLNAVELTESADQYGAIESGDDAEKDDVDLGEYDSDQSVEKCCAPDDLVDDVDETEAEIAEEVLFAENFLESFGGADEVLAAGHL